jgi:hypothetical protein
VFAVHHGHQGVTLKTPCPEKSHMDTHSNILNSPSCPCGISQPGADAGPTKTRSSGSAPGTLPVLIVIFGVDLSSHCENNYCMFVDLFLIAEDRFVLQRSRRVLSPWPKAMAQRRPAGAVSGGGGRVSMDGGMVITPDPLPPTPLPPPPPRAHGFHRHREIAQRNWL